MTAAPFSHYAEPFRMLRSNIELAWARKPTRVIMITSGTAGEGKSTTTANLGISFASSGRSTVLVDLDVAAPALAPALGAKTPSGLANVVAGELTLEQALVAVPLPHVGMQPYRQSERSLAAGQLFVLGAGFQPSGRLDMATLRELPRVFEHLAGIADVVLVDAPPLLVAGDALALTAYVDAVVVVARLNVVRADALDELHRVLESCPAEKLGAVVTGASTRSEYYGSYFSSGNGELDLSDHERDPALTSRPRSSRLFTSIRR
jgi:Mrp family chromosome partitioning ATPase